MKKVMFWLLLIVMLATIGFVSGSIVGFIEGITKVILAKF